MKVMIAVVSKQDCIALRLQFLLNFYYSYLINNGSRLDVVSFDGELPVDVTQDEAMVHFLSDTMAKHGWWFYLSWGSSGLKSCHINAYRCVKNRCCNSTLIFIHTAYHQRLCSFICFLMICINVDNYALS